MTADQLEMKWQSITPGLTLPYRSLRIDAVCMPELYLSLDIKNYRTLILQVPQHTPVNCRALKMENLSIEWHPESRFLLISLRNPAFFDLFNDFTLSLYNRIKSIASAENYSHEFIDTFHKWAEFFENTSTKLLSEPALKGLFGELIMLRKYLLESTGFSADHLLTAWQGPFNRAQDFFFRTHNVEVKTKDHDEANIRISSEFQLEAEAGKGLTLAVVNLIRQPDGVTIRDLIGEIRSLLITQAGDLPAFLSLIARAGLNFSDAGLYNSYIWKLQNILFHDVGLPDFPRITSTVLRPAINRVSYNLNVFELTPFLNQTYTP